MRLLTLSRFAPLLVALSVGALVFGSTEAQAQKKKKKPAQRHAIHGHQLGANCDRSTRQPPMIKETDRRHYGSAVEFCERAVGRAPGNARYHIHLGDAYYKTLRFSQARTHYLKARQLGDPKAERKLAKVRAKLGE